MSESETPRIPGDPPEKHLSARVPEDVSRGVFSNAVIVMSGGNEFIIDFVQNLGHPPQVAARVVMPHATLPQFIKALQENIGNYQQRFGEIPELPRAPNTARQQTPQEIYDDLKLPDSMLAGSYANGVMIGHSASEFKFDFLTNLFPHTAVSARVFLAGPQVPRMLESLQRNYQQFVERVKQQQQPPPPTDDPPSEPTDS